MGKSVSKSARAGKRPAKPTKPYADFPLYPHNTRRWCKKIRGVVHYFGAWDDPQGALDRYLKVKDYLHAGKRPPATGDGLTIRDLCNRFLTSKLVQVNAGELQQRTFLDYKQIAGRIIGFFGKDRLVSDLRPTDFSDLKGAFSDGRGVESLGNLIQRSRCIFNWAYQSDLITAPLKYGADFRKPGKAARRRAAQQNPPKLFTADEIRAIIDAAPLQLRAMVLLGVSSGMGNTDCSSLRERHLDLDKGIMDYPRPKTGIERRVALWPETVKALETVLAARPKAKVEAESDLVFLTRTGTRWVKTYEGDKRDSGKRVGGTDNAITKEFTKLLNKLGIRRKGVGFYALRHVFETIGGACGDQAAVNRAMGHDDGSMASVYRVWLKDQTEDARLRAVAAHVHEWLFASSGDEGRI